RRASTSRSSSERFSGPRRRAGCRTPMDKRKRNMRSGVIAQKVGMTRVFTEAGEHVPVTVLKMENVQVLADRTDEKNGYTALQLGAGTRKVSRVTRAERGNFAVSQVEPKRKLAEFRVSADNLIDVGAEITADHFVKG